MSKRGDVSSVPPIPKPMPENIVVVHDSIRILCDAVERLMDSVPPDPAKTALPSAIMEYLVLTATMESMNRAIALLARTYKLEDQDLIVRMVGLLNKSGRQFQEPTG